MDFSLSDERYIPFKVGSFVSVDAPNEAKVPNIGIVSEISDYDVDGPMYSDDCPIVTYPIITVTWMHYQGQEEFDTYPSAIGPGYEDNLTCGELWVL